ncbi:hypothetical protein [Clostridium scatologenes]|uniref:Uncharacterized protein n=1 Tax=Clostridium scatologenes TaxID=1548 RepID=A0A0E3GPR9_CLOSL|nr:hypothetical protein [Clostridium scatologenes]AKA67301.1 hypothetical protein CSCA_0176 [Clostridium scatologenes]
MDCRNNLKSIYVNNRNTLSSQFTITLIVNCDDKDSYLLKSIIGSFFNECFISVECIKADESISLVINQLKKSQCIISKLSILNSSYYSEIIYALEKPVILITKNGNISFANELGFKEMRFLFYKENINEIRNLKDKFIEYISSLIKL